MKPNFKLLKLSFCWLEPAWDYSSKEESLTTLLIDRPRLTGYNYRHIIDTESIVLQLILESNSSCSCIWVAFQKIPFIYTQTHSEGEILLLLKPGVCLHLYFALVLKICLLTFNTHAAGLQQLTRLRAQSHPLPWVTLYPHCFFAHPLPQLRTTCSPKKTPSIPHTIP